MSTDTDKTITDNAVISEEILGKKENAAREGARQGSKESRGGRGGIGLFETIKTLILEKEGTINTADRFAKMSVWEIYQPIIDKVTTGYSLEVEFE